MAMFAMETTTSNSNAYNSYQMGRFLSDNDYPITLSASAFEPSVKSRVKRAIAEVDGMVAGITFLDKGGQMPVADVVSDIWDLTHGLQDDGQHLFSTETIVPDTPSRLPEATYVAKPRCDDPHRAWTALSELKDGMRRQFDRFCKIASYDNVPEIIRLRDFYTSANAMSDMGLQTYRDVLQGSVPDTLAEVFAFAALSYAISDILLHHGRMREEEILSGLSRWRDCINNSEERKAFNSLSAEMWSLNHLPPLCQVAERCTEPNSQSFQENLRQQMSLDESLEAILADMNSEPTSLGSGQRQTQNVTATSFQQVACDTSSGLGLPSEDNSAEKSTSNDSVKYKSMEQDVYDLTDRTSEAFGFSQLLSFSNWGENAELKYPVALDASVAMADFDTLGNNNFMNYVPPTREHLLDFSLSSCPSFTSNPTTNNAARKETAPRLNFQLCDQESDSPVFRLRNTVMFHAVLIFTKDTGDYFFLLSNRGATVTCQKTGSGYASSRSKAERKLRKEFFKPLKKAMASNESFLALLSVAKKFVVVGSLSTLEEVQDYLLALSTQLISPEDHVSFVRWIFNNPGEAEVKQHSPSLNRKRKTPSDGPPKNSVAEKRQKQ
ncbi:uncharacterized protein CTRU02_209500 [Colletotrichum truncatum]|uniref:Uncharacterized protein n=1 Tax=Colletotrichum truncatum TaxID=5467 RepID=A0ACC3YSJ2_COLTU